MSTDKNGRLLLPSGVYEKLKSFQLARLVYDITEQVNSKAQESMQRLSGEVYR